MGILHGTATVSVSHYFSYQHLRSAELFRDLAMAIESQSEVTDAEGIQHRAFVTATVVFSVCYIEAAINELYVGIVRSPPVAVGEQSDPKRDLLAELWDLHLEESPTLLKYQVVLAVRGCSVFDKGKEPYQAMDALIRVRNALIHYRPEPSDDLDEHKKLRSRLTGRFRDNSLAAQATLWFPHVCLGSGCAAWAVSRVKTFMADFQGRLETAAVEVK